MRFLRGKVSKELMIFSFFLILSVFFWLLLSLNEVSEDEFTIPVEYAIPEKVFITNTLPTEFSVRLRDRGSVLLGYMINGISPIQFNFEEFEGENGIVVLTQNQIIPTIRRSLNITTSILSVRPDSLFFYQSQTSGKKVPIRVRGRFVTNPQCVIGQITSSVDSALVFAPERILNRIDELYTDSLNAENLSDTLITSLQLQPIKGAKFVPDKVQITVPVEEITVKMFDVPVTVKNLPRELSLLTFPARVQLFCMVALSDFSKIKPEDFQVAVDYLDILKSPGEKQAVKLYMKPDKVGDIQIEPDSVEYILEESMP